MLRSIAIASLAVLAASCSQEQAPDEQEAPVTSETIAPAGWPPRYTSLVDCELRRSAPDEAGFFETECPGEGGYRLRRVQSDLRDNIVVLSPDGGETSLSLPALANGGFSNVGDQVEWRGDPGDAEFVPRAIIFRHSVMEDPDPAVPEVSYLLVTKLGTKPCVVARIAPEPNQNDQARQAAARDRECLPGTG